MMRILATNCGGKGGTKGVCKTSTEEIPKTPHGRLDLREAASQGIGAFSKDMAMKAQKFQEVDYYHPSNGDKVSGKIVKVTDTHHHIKDRKTGVVHKFLHTPQE